jgi:hypothetical protein
MGTRVGKLQRKQPCVARLYQPSCCSARPDPNPSPFTRSFGVDPSPNSLRIFLSPRSFYSKREQLSAVPADWLKLHKTTLSDSLRRK